MSIGVNSQSIPAGLESMIEEYCETFNVSKTRFVIEAASTKAGFDLAAYDAEQERVYVEETAKREAEKAAKKLQRDAEKMVEAINEIDVSKLSPEVFAALAAKFAATEKENVA